LKSEVKLEEAVAIRNLVEHKAQLPNDLTYLTQVAYRPELPSDEIEELTRIMNLQGEEWNTAVTDHMFNPSGLPEKAVRSLYASGLNKWYPMRASSSPFMSGILITGTPYNSVDWTTPNLQGDHEYIVDSSMCLTSTLSDAVLAISYMRYPVKANGDTLIPDDEDLKEAIVHYCLYRYWLTRSFLREPNADKERDYHLSRYEVLMAKAGGELNLPTLDELENLKNLTNRLVPRSNQYDNFFSKLNNRESADTMSH